MARSSVNISFVDGGLGIVTGPLGGTKTQLMVGISAGGTPGTVIPISSPTTATRLLVAGPLWDAVYNRVSLSGSMMLAVPLPIATAGSCGAWTQQGSGAGVVSATVANFQQILVKCILGGSLATATFQFSVNGSAYSATVTSAAGWSSTGYRVPGTLTTLIFGAFTYRANDVYTIPTTGVCSASSPAGGPTGPTQSSSPADAYELLLTITTSGTLGTSQFTYSLDNGNTTSAPMSTAASVILPNTGIVLGFTAANYNATDIYTAVCVNAAYQSSDVTAAIVAALAQSNPFEGVDCIGMPANAAGAYSFASALDLELQSAAASNKVFIWGITNCPTVESDATVTAAFASFTSATGRTSVCIGTQDVQSIATGLMLRRPIGWNYGTRLASIRYAESPGWVGRGGLPGILAIQNAYGTTGLNGAATADTFDSARFVTLCQGNGYPPGMYVTHGNTMALATSDYSQIMAVRVADYLATIAQAALTLYLQADWRINPDTGQLDKRDVGTINAKITQLLTDAVIGQPGSANDNASSVMFALDPTSNLLSNETLLCALSCVLKGYSNTINCNFGFVNPRLTVAP
jgi:Protein of unknown function (DUF2586)